MSVTNSLTGSWKLIQFRYFPLIALFLLAQGKLGGYLMPVIGSDLSSLVTQLILLIGGVVFYLIAYTGELLLLNEICVRRAAISNSALLSTRT